MSAIKQAIYNGRLVNVVNTEKGHALVTSTHNPRPTWVSLKYIQYIKGGNNNVAKA